MIDTSSGFARYSKALCWVVSFIWLLLAVLSFTGDGNGAMLNGFLWLVGAFAFAISAIFLSRNSQGGEVATAMEQPSE